MVGVGHGMTKEDTAEVVEEVTEEAKIILWELAAAIAQLFHRHAQEMLELLTQVVEVVVPVGRAVMIQLVQVVQEFS